MGPPKIFVTWNVYWLRCQSRLQVSAYFCVFTVLANKQKVWREAENGRARLGRDAKNTDCRWLSIFHTLYSYEFPATLIHGQFPLAKFWCKLLTSCQVLFPTSHRDVPYRDEFIQSVGVFSFSLMCESVAAQFLILDTFVPRENSCGERFSFVEDNEKFVYQKVG